MNKPINFTDLQIVLKNDKTGATGSGTIEIHFIFKSMNVTKTITIIYDDTFFKSYESKGEFTLEQQEIIKSKMPDSNPFIIVHQFFTDLQNQLLIT